MKIFVTVKPNAKKTQVTRISETEIKAEIHAPARDGKANAELVRALATFFHVPQSRIIIARGTSGKKKVIEII